MNRTIRITLGLCLIYTAVQAAATEQTRPKHYEFGEGLVLTIDLPSAWGSEFEINDKGGAELSLVNREKPREKGRLYIVPVTKAPSDDEIKLLLESNASRHLDRSVEKEIAFHPIPKGSGYFFVLTDSNPKANEARLMSWGGAASEKHLLLFSALFDRRDDPFFQTWLDTFARARITKK